MLRKTLHKLWPHDPECYQPSSETLRLSSYALESLGVFCLKHVGRAVHVGVLCAKHAFNTGQEYSGAEILRVELRGILLD